MTSFIMLHICLTVSSSSYSSGRLRRSLITHPPPNTSQWFHFRSREARVASLPFPAFISVTVLIALCCASTLFPLPPYYVCHQFSHLFHPLSLLPAQLEPVGPTLNGLQGRRTSGFQWDSLGIARHSKYFFIYS